MTRALVKIDTAKCDGCGLCASACHEGAIVVRNGKAKLENIERCDGLGNCLPACPKGAILITKDPPEVASANCAEDTAGTQPQARQWPLQLKLLRPTAPFFENADVLVAASCTAFSCVDFHSKLAAGKALAVGCPKFDGIDYSGKLTAIFTAHDVKSVTVARMEVPCCRGMLFYTQEALQAAGKSPAVRDVVLSLDGATLSDTKLEATK
jgi:ferredoxin